jgi:carbon storage regulator
MLFISRKLGESFFIGDAIEVTVERIKNGKVRLSFKAPRAVPIVRAELERKTIKLDSPQKVQNDGNHDS